MTARSAVAVAFQGERGAYSEIAAHKHFPAANLVPFRSFQDVFDSIKSGSVDYAVVPVENSIEGAVSEVYDLLLQVSGITVTGEIYLRIRHCLIANKGVKVDKIKSVYSHPQALAQCRTYLQQKKLEPVPVYDTAGSVKLVKEQGLQESGAIASNRAADLYDMEIVEEGIEDRKNNFTRFLVLSKTSKDTPSEDRLEEKTRQREGAAESTRQHKKAKKTGKNAKSGRLGSKAGISSNEKTSIIFSVSHVPGALFRILKEFASRKINLTKIESRPTKETPWEYNFYMDLEGNVNDRQVRDALESIKKKTSFIKILGSYRKAEFS
jgi:prephenate dehydratase